MSQIEEEIKEDEQLRDDVKDEETEKGIKIIQPKSKGRKFRVNCKNLFLTYPQNVTEPNELLRFITNKFEKWEPSYIGVVRELHKSGEPHLHAIVVLKKECDIRDGNAYLTIQGSKGVNIGVVRNMEKAIKYIGKDSQPIEFGERPKPKVIQKSKKEICESVVKEQLDTGKVDFKKLVIDCPESLLIVDKLKGNLKLTFDQDERGTQTKGKRGIYIVGETNVGKSFGVRNCVGKILGLEDTRRVLYLKDATNYWQRYAGERYVLMDDLDPRNITKVYDELKLWTDRYGISGQKKCTDQIALKYKCIFITSQYGLDQLGGNGGTENQFDDKLAAALQRRFYVIDIRDEGLNWQWWIQKEQLMGLSEEDTLKEKRKCLEFCILNFEAKIQIEFD